MSVTTADPEPATGPATRSSWHRYLRPLTALVASQLVGGVLIGLIWRSWSPSSVSYLLSDGNGGSLVVPDESESQIAGDGRFVVLSVLAGLLFGLAAWLLRRHRGPVTLAVLGLGSLASSLVALGTGLLVAHRPPSPAINSAFHPKLALHAGATLWLQALFAVLLYTILAGLAADSNLGLAPARQPAAEPSQPGSGQPGPGQSELN